MAGLCWVALVTLVLLQSAGNSLAAVDQNQLAGIVTEVLNRYRPSYMGNTGTRRYPMFSLAVSIPYNEHRKVYDMSQVTDSGENVRDEILNCEVYTGSRVVAATVLRWPNVLDQCPNGRVQWNHVLRRCNKNVVTWADLQRECPDAVREGAADHAEYRTLQRFNKLLNNFNKNDLLLFYVLASPCDKRCTNEENKWNILGSINRILKWNNYAVVFSNVFQPRGGTTIPEQKLSGALQRLGTHNGPLGSIGLSNIFRCNGQGAVQCTSCSSGTKVARYCLSDDLKPSIIQPQPGRSYSPSQSGQAGTGKRSDSINPHTGLSTNVDSNTGGGQGGGGSGRARRRHGRGKKGKSMNTGDGVSLQQSGLEIHDTNADINTGGGLGDGRRRSNSFSSRTGVSTNVDSNTGGGQGGGGSGRARRRRGRGKKGKSMNTGEMFP